MQLFSIISSSPFIAVLFYSVVLTFLFFMTKKTIFPKKELTLLKIFIYLLALIVIILYFGFTEILLIIALFIGSFVVGFKFFAFKDSCLLSFISGFFILLGVYIFISLISNPQTGLLALFSVCLTALFLEPKKNTKLIITFYSNISSFLGKLNFIEVLLITLSFLISSFPQGHWDAVQNNLYVAKQYIANNSLYPLEEAVPSLFPQNAILYYSLFYQLGDVKGLQIAYIFPLVILIALIKKFIERYNLKSVKLFIYGLIFTPIVIFQASNGYYDLFILLLILSAIYILLTKKLDFKKVFIATFLIGLASGAKHFPAVLIFLPVLIFLVFENHHKKILNVVSLLLVGLIPLGIWLGRSYLSTGSPIFPFFQNIFPTPEYWPIEDVIENNPMIKSPISALNWITGGAVIYSILTFFFTEKYIEASLGYSGSIYIFFIIFQLVILFIVIKRIVSRNFQKLDLIFIYVFCAYIVVGLVTRYYRYLWPFQFTLGFLSILYLKDFSIFDKGKKNFLKLIAVSILTLNFFGIFLYFNNILPSNEFLLKPDYYLTNSSNVSSILFLNNQVKQEEDVVVLDASKGPFGRFNLKSKVYSCNWYWLNVYENWKRWKVDDNFRKQTIAKFNYVITDNDVHILCKELVEKQEGKLNLIYKDNRYNIYKVH